MKGLLRQDGIILPAGRLKVQREKQRFFDLIKKGRVVVDPGFRKGCQTGMESL